MGSLEEIDRICEHYEQWCESVGASPRTDSCLVGPARMVRFLKERESGTQISFLVWKSLCQVDIDVNWMSWSRIVDEQASSARIEQIRQWRSEIPTLADYAREFSSSVVNDVAWKDIARTEAGARRQWGDNIGVAYYREEFGLRIPAESCHAQRFIEFRSSHAAGRESAMRLPLRGSSTVGRQRSTDPAPFSYSEKATGNRIIVASYKDTSISREHLTIELLNPRYAVVANRGTVAPISSDCALQTGEAVVIKFPFTIRLDSLRLFCC